MRVHKCFATLAVLILTSLALAACGAPSVSAPSTSPSTSAAAISAAPASSAAAGSTTSASASTAGGETANVSVQLKWVAQAQFAGYYAALDQGFYEAENLNVTVKPGGPDIVPEQVVASGQAEFGIDWLASLLATREQGTPLVNIAQVYTNAGMRQLSWKDTNIVSPADLKGKKVAVWFGGNEYNLLATLAKYNINKDSDVTLVQQPFDMNLLLNREVDSAAAMTYNELYQVLSAGHTIDELNIIDYNTEETAMPEDGIFASEEWLNAAPENKDIAARFLRATFRGWEYCRDNADSCVESVLKNDVSGSATAEAQKWQMDEVNKLIWGDPINKETRIGYMEPDLFKRGADTALQFGVIKQAADESAYTHELWELATQ